MEHPLSAYLVSAGLTQLAFAKSIDADASTIGRVCKGQMPRLPLAIAIERGTGNAVTVEMLCAAAQDVGAASEDHNPEAVA